MISFQCSYLFLTLNSPQATLPFTIREYVGVGSLEHWGDDARIQESLAFAAADEVVSSLPDGLDSYAGGSVGNRIDHRWNFPRVIGASGVPYVSYEPSTEEGQLGISSERSVPPGFNFTDDKTDGGAQFIPPPPLPNATPTADATSILQFASIADDSAGTPANAAGSSSNAPSEPKSEHASIANAPGSKWGPRKGFTKVWSPHPAPRIGNLVQSIWYPRHSPEATILSGGQVGCPFPPEVIR